MSNHTQFHTNSPASLNGSLSPLSMFSTVPDPVKTGNFAISAILNRGFQALEGESNEFFVGFLTQNSFLTELTITVFTNTLLFTQGVANLSQRIEMIRAQMQQYVKPLDGQQTPPSEQKTLTLVEAENKQMHQDVQGIKKNCVKKLFEVLESGCASYALHRFRKGIITPDEAQFLQKYFESNGLTTKDMGSYKVWLKEVNADKLRGKICAELFKKIMIEKFSPQTQASNSSINGSPPV